MGQIYSASQMMDQFTRSVEYKFLQREEAARLINLAAF